MAKNNGQNIKNTKNELEHFVNDVKYVTSSLVPDRRALLQKFKEEIFTIDSAEIKERFAAEYEPFLFMIHSKLHIGQSSVTGPQIRVLLWEYEAALLQLQSQFAIAADVNDEFMKQLGFGIGQTFGQQKIMKRLVSRIRQEVIPSRTWLLLDNHENICLWLNEAQTKVEDVIKSKKRILKVWSEEVLLPEYETMIESFVKHMENGFKIFQGSYWSERKKLRSLFIEDVSLLNDQEYRILLSNLKLLKSSEAWLEQHQDTLVMTLGSSYQGLDTHFDAIRRQYEAFYSIFLQVNEWKTNTTIVDINQQLNHRETLATEDGFCRFYECIQKLYCFDIDQCIQQLTQYFSWFDRANIEQYSVVELTQIIDKTQAIVNHFKSDYYQFYDKLNSTKEDLTIEGMRKVIYRLERIRQKEKWLNTNEKKIVSFIGPLDSLKSTDWDMVRRSICKQDSKTEQHKIVVEFEDYVPMTQQRLEVILSDAGKQPEDVLRAVIEYEQPIHLSVVLKRTASLLQLSRVTKGLKEKAATLIAQMIQEGWNYEEDFIWKGDVLTNTFRKNPCGQEKRELAMIAPVELKAGIYRLMEARGESKTEEISKQIAKLLLVPRRNQSFSNQIEQAVFSLKRENRIVRHSGGWRIVSKS